MLVTFQDAHDADYCFGCGAPKEKGLLVCWTCFHDGDLSLKHFKGSFHEWVQQKKHRRQTVNILRENDHPAAHSSTGMS